MGVWRKYTSINLCRLLASLTPQTVLQPLPDDPPSPKHITSITVKLAWDQLFAMPPPERFLVDFSHVDVRDVADIHIRALEMEEAAGERFMASPSA